MELYLLSARNLASLHKFFSSSAKLQYWKFSQWEETYIENEAAGYKRQAQRGLSAPHRHSTNLLQHSLLSPLFMQFGQFCV